MKRNFYEKFRPVAAVYLSYDVIQFDSPAIMMVDMLSHNFQAWKWSNLKIISRKYCLSVISVQNVSFSHPPIPPVPSTQGFVYCYGAAILLRAESGGEVIAWLAYGKPPSSIHLSLPFIIQLYQFPAAKLFIIKFIPCLSGSLPLFLFTGVLQFRAWNSLQDVKNTVYAIRDH